MKTSLDNFKQKIAEVCLKYEIADLYVYGSRSKEIAALVYNLPLLPEQPERDLDVGILPEKKEVWYPQKRVNLIIELEDLFHVNRVDLVLLPKADPYLALDIIRGELLYTRDPDQQASYELFILRQAGDLLPYKNERIQMILEDNAR